MKIESKEIETGMGTFSLVLNVTAPSQEGAKKLQELLDSSVETVSKDIQRIRRYLL